jgi:hypothetical protein
VPPDLSRPGRCSAPRGSSIVQVRRDSPRRINTQPFLWLALLLLLLLLGGGGISCASSLLLLLLLPATLLSTTTRLLAPQNHR